MEHLELLDLLASGLLPLSPSLESTGRHTCMHCVCRFVRHIHLNLFDKELLGCPILFLGLLGELLPLGEKVATSASSDPGRGHHDVTSAKR